MGQGPGEAQSALRRDVPLRCVLVTETYPPEVNGVAMTLRRLVTGMRACGHEMTVIRPRQASDKTRGGRLGDIPVPGMPLPGYTGLRMGLPFYGRIKRHLRQVDPEVVHIATEGPLGWVALWAARALGKPVASSFHTNFHQYGRHYGYGFLKGLAVSYLRAFHNRTRLTMVPTREMVEVLQADHFERLAILSRGIDINLFTPERLDPELRSRWGCGPGDTVVIYVGRLAGEKNIDLAVRAFAKLHEQDASARFVLVGDGPERKHLQAKYPNFIYAGLQRGEDLARHYASGDLFLFPSVTETFGNVVTEALASGLVVAGFRYAALREFITDGDNGFLAPLESGEKGFHATVARAIAAKTAWPLIRTQARKAMLEQSWDAVIANYVRMLRTVASAGEIT